MFRVLLYIGLSCSLAWAGCGPVLSEVNRRLLERPVPRSEYVHMMRRAFSDGGEDNNFLLVARVLERLNVDEAETVVRAFLMLEQRDRIMVFTHVARLEQMGFREDAVLAARLLPHWPTLYSSLPVTPPTPEIAKAIRIARAGWKDTRDKVMNHIRGDDTKVDTMTSGLLCFAGGGHTVKGHEAVLRHRWEERLRTDPVLRGRGEEILAQARIAIGRDSGARATMRILRDIGFTNSAETYVWHVWLKELRGSNREPSNGVIRILLDRGMLLSNGWSNTVGSSAEAMSPPGGKTLFPVDWSEFKIERAILKILLDPKSVVVNPKGGDGVRLRFYLRGEVDGVFILVGVHETGEDKYEVGSAFPAWRQRLPYSVESMYRLHEVSETRAAAAVMNINRHHLTTAHEPGLADAIAFYTGKKPAIAEPDFSTLSLWFNPARLASQADENVDLSRASQEVIFDFLETRRILREIGRKVLPP